MPEDANPAGGPVDNPKPAKSSRKVAGTVEKATRAELRRLKCSVASEGLAALAVSLAKQIDSARGAVAAAAAAGQLRLILADLVALAEAKRPERDGIDELRDRARAGVSGAAVVRGAPFGQVRGRKSG